MQTREDHLAQELFAAYNDEGPNPWKTFDGKDVPTWDQLNDQVRGKWVAAAVRARKLLAPAVLVGPADLPKGDALGKLSGGTITLTAPTKKA